MSKAQHGPVRRAALAGSWYPADPAALRRELSEYLKQAGSLRWPGELQGLIAPHAGLMYSGPVAAYAYALLPGRPLHAVVLVGPSHFVGFEGVALYERGAFETPLGSLPIAETLAGAMLRASPLVRSRPEIHGREHSLEMQLPFLAAVQPGVPIVPLLMGYQSRETVLSLAEALVGALRGQRVLMIASTDLSHYFDARTAARLDGRVAALIDPPDPEGLLEELERYPDHQRGRYVACGGGPAISVMLAARGLGATCGRILRYADSGDVSGDKAAVVGYLAAALGTAGGTGQWCS